MTRVRVFGSTVAGLAAAVLLAAAGPAGGQPAKKAEPQIVAKIKSVDLKIQTADPPNLVVTAVGEVPTLGYDPNLVTLIRAVYVTPPKDGIQDYYLSAVPPDGLVGQQVSEVKGVNTWKAYTKAAPWLKGVRVHGAGDGVVVKMLDGK